VIREQFHAYLGIRLEVDLTGLSAALWHKVELLEYAESPGAEQRCVGVANPVLASSDRLYRWRPTTVYRRPKSAELRSKISRSIVVSADSL
jgi:hypothetical protein